MKPERFTTLAVNFDGPPGAVSTPLDITVTRWSTDAERDRLFNVLLEKGSDKLLLDVLRGMPPVGRINTPGNVGWELRYAAHTGAPGRADQITLITDRPVGFSEAAMGSRTLDYPFTLIDLRINSAGNGDGKLLIGAKIQMDRMTKTMLVEDYNIRPVTLTAVKRDSGR